MLRITKCFLTQEVLPNYCQSIRWRKPRWLPMAKSKMFKINPRPVIPQDEAEELKRLYNIYRTQMKSVTKYLTDMYHIDNLQTSGLDQHKKAFEQDFARCMEINDKWNEQLRVEREAYFNKELENSIDVAKNRLNNTLQKKIEQLQLAEDIVREEKKAAENFITVENIDSAIEHALNNPVDHNFALDVDGTKIYGRETKAPVKIKQ